jgi:hypothetical protein
MLCLRCAALVGALTLAACGGRSGEKTAAAGRPAGESAGGMMGMPGMDSGTGMGGMHMQGMEMRSTMRSHLDSMTRMSPEQMRAAMAQHDALMSQMMDRMGGDMRSMPMTGDTAWNAFTDSVKRDLADPQPSGQSLVGAHEGPRGSRGAADDDARGDEEEHAAPMIRPELSRPAGLRLDLRSDGLSPADRPGRPPLPPRRRSVRLPVPASPELLDREAHEQVDAAADQQERVRKGPALFLVRADHRGGVGHAPMRNHRLPREDGAGLRGSVAHRDHEVPALSLQTLEAPWLVPGPEEPMPLHRLDGESVHPGGRLRARTLGREAAASLAIQNGLRHLTAGAVAGAEEEDSKWHRRINLPRRIQAGNTVCSTFTLTTTRVTAMLRLDHHRVTG